MRAHRVVHHLLSLLVSLSLLLTSVAPVSAAAIPPLPAGEGPGMRAVAPQRPAPTGDFALYRTHITIENPARRARLDALGVAVLEEGDGWAVVLADDEQLETLARLRYQPQASDEFVSLVEANTAENSWLAAAVEPLLVVGRTVSATGDSRTTSPTYEERVAARSSLRAFARALTPEQRTALADLTSLDDDADGLTNAQEAWWCTDPLNADTDGDGTSDGAEVSAAKDWLGNRRAGPPASGRPFAGWPPATFDTTRPPTCRDGDADGVPDMAERWDLGLNMNAESTDRDKFDDGQELFGTTEWGRGALPRVTDDAGYIFAEMPTWVKAPGNHPFVAAFPTLDIIVMNNSLSVQPVTTITTEDGQMTSESRTYETSKTEGVSTAETDTVTWNEWEEVSQTTPVAAAANIRSIDAWPAIALQVLKGVATVGSVASLFGGKSGDSKYQEELAKFQLNDTRCSRMKPGLRQVLIAGAWVDCKVQDFFYEPAKPTEQNITNITQISKDYIDQRTLINNCSGDCAQGLLFGDGSDYVGLNNISHSSQDILPGGAGQSYYGDSAGQLMVQPRLALSYPVQRPTVTQTSGTSSGGERSTTQTQYTENTITQGEQFTSGRNWSTARATNSSHVADLRFSYRIANDGTEYAKEIGGIVFNIYVDDDENPIYSYSVAADIGADGKFHNLMPNEDHTYASRSIPLTLEQMRRIDVSSQCDILRATGKVDVYPIERCPGAKVRVVVEEFTYGVDELFYQDAANAGVLVAMEDGTDDGDERIDSYLLPTWGEESVVDALARYFPHTVDENGTVIAIWTPEYRSDTPAWCAKPNVVGIGSQRTLWCKHALSTADWWNVYTNGLGDGSEGFQDTPAAPGAVALFRFNSDRDLDGYSDRSEERLGTDPNDASDFPRPELLAGLHSIRSGNYVTATLSLLNTGLYDAYGVEAVLIAPDDSVSITNNTVGGSGRVRAQKQVIVGSRIALQTPLPAAWTQAGHAVPAAGGYYTGGEDRTYTFGVVCGNPGGCSVGSGAWSVNWADSKGVTGTLSYGDGYASPTFRPVGAHGLTLALHSGTVAVGESFTVDARTPRDTFQYQIAAGRENDYTQPLVIVSYNDPQGNHRFILPPSAADLTTPSDNLASFAGQMLDDVGVEIVTMEEYTGGPTSTSLLVNNPSETTVTDAHVFLEFINISGTVVSEVSTQVTLPPGPTTASIAWDSVAFDPAYRADEDYIVMAFLTDYQGNILDTAGRPLSSFQDDPRPAAALDNGAQVWDFGTAQQGTLLEHPFALASVGYLDLLAYLGNAPGLSVDGPAATSISPGDVALYTVQLNSESLSVGAFEATIPVRTSDPQNPSARLTIRGTITPMPADAPGGAVLRPLDVDAAIPGDHSAGEWVNFTHSLGPDAGSLQPVKVYSQDYGNLYGVGKYATDFGAGTASAAIFGDGANGPLIVTSGQTVQPSNLAAPLTASVNAGQTSLSILSTPGFNASQEILIHQTQGTGAGNYEFATIASVDSGVLTLKKPIVNTYTNGGNSHAQVVRVNHYTDVTVQNGGVLSAPAWDGNTGGILVFKANGLTAIQSGGNATISGGQGVDNVASDNAGGGIGGGFRGGNNIYTPGQLWTTALQGEGINGLGSRLSTQNANGGGGACPCGPRGAGGGNGSAGQSTFWDSSTAFGGSPVGVSDLTIAAFGGGGGGGARSGDTADPNSRGAGGGAGGGIIIMPVRVLETSGGTITANGGRGGNTAFDTVDQPGFAGGGGAGGSIWITTENGNLGANRVTALGGAGGSGGFHGGGGAGGTGRVRVEYCDTLSGTTNPAASTQKLNCYIAEQVETTPYSTARLNLPESFTGGRTYKVQYGRRLQFATAGTQTTTIRLPKQLYSDATLDVLVNNTGVASGAFALSVDFGNNGTTDWSRNATTTFPATLNITGTVSALNAYLVSRSDVAWGANVDVPVRVVSDRAADVLLTNLVLRLQVNQPTARAADVEIAADRPLDWPLYVAGNYSQGAQYDFTHTLGQDAASLHPCTVYDQSGKILKGVGKYCRDFGKILVPVPFPYNSSLESSVRPGAPWPLGQVELGGISFAIPSQFNVWHTHDPWMTGGNPRTLDVSIGQTGVDWVYSLINTGGGESGPGIYAWIEFFGDQGAYYRKDLDGNVDIRDYNRGGWTDTINGTTTVNVFLHNSGVQNLETRLDMQKIDLPAAFLTQRLSIIRFSDNGASNFQRIFLAGLTLAPLYAAEGLESSPHTTTRLYLPDAVSGSRSYLVQYARRFVFAAPGQQTSSLRLNRRVYGSASLDLLVSNAGAASGNLALCLDIGNDGVCDYNHNASTNFPATLEADGLAEALNNYLLSRTDVAWGDPVDVPVSLTLDRQADVMLTNLALTPLGAKTRFVRLEARTYQTATLGLEFRQPGVASGPLAFTVDVGADGTVDWSYAGTPNFPANLTSPNLAVALNAYLAGRSGDVDVPIRIVPSPFLAVSLTDFDASPSDRPDLTPLAPTAGVARSGDPIVEGDTVPLTAVIQNSGPADSGPLAVTFFAIRNLPPASFYIGTSFVKNVPKTGSALATIPWNTLGFSGDVTVRAVVDPFNRTAEGNESNNSATAVIPIRTRPDLRVSAIALSNPLLMAGETVTVTLTLSNTGQTAAGGQSVALYDANPDSGGISVETQNLASLPGETATTIQFQWTPSAPGPYRLFSLSDQNNAVNEFDEGNNRAWQDVYVGLAAPVLLDSGQGEAVYSPATGYGVVDEGQADVLIDCGSGATTEETQRLDFDGRLVYRFDHLLPGRFYHLDVTLYECTGAGRQQSIFIDGNTVDGPINLGDGEVHHRSILIDPALYADHSVQVSIESPGVNGAIVSAVNLHAVDYRYADSGGTNDPAYSAALGYGAVSGVPNSAWGRLPYQSVRVNQTGRSVDYRYDGLTPDKFYQLHLSFYQTGDTSRVQQVEIDGKVAGAEISLPNNQKQRISLPVPTGTYTDDGSISVSVVRVNADVGAIVNEIALEEITVPTGVCGVTPTPYYTYAYGSITVEGAPALPGTVVTAENPDGKVVGCYRVGQAGFYGFLPIFGAFSPTPGMAEGEQVKFRVNGQLALATPALHWTNDKDIHAIDLTVSGIESQWIRLNPGWTLFSLRVEPPVTSLTDVLNPVKEVYCYVHGENDIFDCDLPPQNQGLTELHGGQAYYIRNDSGATVNLFVQGAPIPPTRPIPLHTDWNWVGYLLQESRPVADALASIAGKYSRVADGKARLYNPALPQFSTLTQLVPDDGYLIFMTDTATLIYPEPLVSAGTEPVAVREVCADVSPTPAFTWLYGGLFVNGQPAPLGTRLDVLTPRGELAGCAVVDTLGLYGFLPVYGADGGNPPLPGFADGEPMTLRVNGQIVELAEPLLWRNDKQERQVDLSATVTERRFFLPLIGR